MAEISAFSKWEGTGNDFILMDDRKCWFPEERAAKIARRLCHRHLGIGADGLILLRQPLKDGDAYHMEFLNPDGSRSFCGNGSRCAFAFWSKLTGSTAPVAFSAVDGDHQAEWMPDGLRVAVRMRDEFSMEHMAAGMDLLHTGSPHLLLKVEDPETVDILPAARAHRHGERFKDAGVNVNFWSLKPDGVHMRTYERGVEDETMSCGTGVTAAALNVFAHRMHPGPELPVHTRGGILSVAVERIDPDGRARGIRLIGPVREVFTGSIAI